MVEKPLSDKELPYSVKIRDLAQECVELLTAKRKTVMTAESVTGGMICNAITDIPGASKILMGGIVCYSAEIKNLLLDVEWELINEFGTVSPEVTRALLKGLKKYGADILVGITGVTTTKLEGHPPGLIYIGLKYGEYEEVKKFLFKGTRVEIKAQAVIKTLEWILDITKNTPE